MSKTQSIDTRVIFHLDMDAFYASIEQRDNPTYKGKPVIVGALPGNRGVVSAASYEARKFGVHSAMPINEAYRRCPQGVYVIPRMHVYSEVSKEIMEILYTFSPLVEQISVDEAFFDMSGSSKLFGDSLQCAQAIQNKILSQCKLTSSIGIAPNKFLAKVASDLKKPMGITKTPFNSDEIREWMAPLSVSRIWGIGKKSENVLLDYDIITIGDLQKKSLDWLIQKFGKSGASLFWLSQGIDNRVVGDFRAAKSISREHTFNVDCSNKDEWKQVLLSLAHDVARRARLSGVKGRTVFLTYRRPDFSRHTKRCSSITPVNTGKALYDQVVNLLNTIREPSLRLIGVGITNLDEAAQTELFENFESEKWEASEKAVDSIIRKFGDSVISHGAEIPLKKENPHFDR